jgi:phage tail P2-like protein
MSNIYDVKLLDLLPPNLRGDPDIIAASKAIDPEFYALANSIKNVLTFGDIDNARSEVVDNLAWELNTDFYDGLLPLEIRKELVKNALNQHMTKGTPSAIEGLVTTLFGEGVVEEWFDYAGQPYYFRVITSNSAVTSDLAEQFTQAVNKVKNLRSRLDHVIISMAGDMALYFANVVHTGDNLTIEQVV